METNLPKEKMQNFIDFKLFEKKNILLDLDLYNLVELRIYIYLTKTNWGGKIGGGLLRISFSIITS